jgi:hypothetical protein
MEIRSSTICFSKKKSIKNREQIKDTILKCDTLEKKLSDNPTEEIIQQYNETKLEIEQYNNEKAHGVFIRSKCDWAEFGEKNTKYFLNLEKRNYNNKCISKLINEEQVTITDSNEILNYETKFYKKLYTIPEHEGNITRENCMEEFLDRSTPKISNENVELCEQQLDMEDIGYALKELQNGKSPGTDGFTPDFYKFFWIKIKTLVFNSIKHAFETGELSIEQKRGIINLIPKKDKDTRYLKNWRPISLLNTDYKILTKALAMKLKRVLPEVINDDQVAYLKDRFIGQNIRAIFDIMEYTKKHNCTGIIAFLDFEKAFDTIRWDVIEDTLKIFGLGENYIKWVKTIYKGSEACVTNNGYSSPFFQLERGVRQGCPLSAYLFIMVVELMSNKIRNTKEIKGIKINEVEIKILQMADDTTIMVEDLNSFKCVLKIISLFHIFAGLKLNKTKTEAMWLGRWKDRKDTPMGLKWVKEVHSLGIFFSYNTDYVVQKNFTDKAKTFKKILDLWSQRDLSLIGKITILKSLAFSTLTYQCGLMNPTEQFIKDITTIAFKFLWNNKPEKIKRKTIIADYSEGGLKMLDFRSFLVAQKAMWVRRLMKGGMASWKAYPVYVYEKILGNKSFRCNLDTTQNKTKLNEFYWEILKAWVDTNRLEFKDMSVFDIRSQCLWMNKHIKVAKLELNWKNWIQHNIFTIHDIVDNEGKFLTPHELNRIFNSNCNVMQYNQLKDAIPKEWREKIKTMKVPRNVFEHEEELYMLINKQHMPLTLITNKDVYWKLVKKIQLPHITKEKWENELNLNSKDWTYYFQNIKIIRDTKIRSFQYKLIFNLVPCNLYLYRIGKSNTFNCNYCAKIDNITHFFYNCNGTKLFWNGIQNWWNTMKKEINNEHEDIIINKSMAILGIKTRKEELYKLNAILQMARWHIYIEKLNNQEPSLYKFLCLLRYKIKIEKIICLRSNILNNFNLLWREIEDHIE